MKKFLSLIVVLALLATLVAIVPVSAGSSAITMAGAVKDPVSGEASVTLTFRVTANAGLDSVGINIGYNADTLKYDSVTNGTILSNVSAADDGGMVKITLTDTASTSTGVLVKVKFTIIDEYGEFDMDVNLAEGTNAALTKNFSNNTQHNYLSLPTTVPATCEADGYTEKTCNTCGKVLEHIVTEEALGHDWELVDEKAATCTENGYRDYECTRCGGVKTETIEAAHTLGEPVVVEATETEDGFETVYCTVCGAVLSKTVIPATGKADAEETTADTKADAETTDSKTTTTSSGNPQTGDTFGTIISVFLAMVAIVAFMYVVGKNNIRLSDLHPIREIKKFLERK